MKRQAYLNRRLKLSRASLAKRRWSRIDLLTQQNRWWVDAHGKLHDVDKIDVDYQVNLLAWFRAHALRIKGTFQRDGEAALFALSRSDSDGTAMAQMLAESELDRIYLEAPGDWIEEQPLVQRLVVLVDRNTKVSIRGELRFKATVQELLDAGTWPGPMAIAARRNLNGRQTKWRAEVLTLNGYHVHPLTGRWGGRYRQKGTPWN